MMQRNFDLFKKIFGELKCNDINDKCNDINDLIYYASNEKLFFLLITCEKCKSKKFNKLKAGLASKIKT